MNEADWEGGRLGGSRALRSPRGRARLGRLPRPAQSRRAPIRMPPFSVAASSKFSLSRLKASRLAMPGAWRARNGECQGRADCEAFQQS
eukprot:3706294-Rhodomonas_salina.1